MLPPPDKHRFLKALLSSISVDLKHDFCSNCQSVPEKCEKLKYCNFKALEAP